MLHKTMFALSTAMILGITTFAHAEDRGYGDRDRDRVRVEHQDRDHDRNRNPDLLAIPGVVLGGVAETITPRDSCWRYSPAYHRRINVCD